MNAADRLDESEQACRELGVGAAALHDHVLELGRRVRRLELFALVLLALVLLQALCGCSGAPFEQDSPAGGALTSAQSGASSLPAGGSVLLSGGTAGAPGGVAGAVAAGNAAGNSGSADGAAGDPADVVSGGAGGAAARPCDVSHWTAQAFASRDTTTPPAAALDGSPATRWTSGTERQAGQWFELELGAGVVLEQLELRDVDAPGDLPSSAELELDGQPTPATFEAAAGVLRVRFASTPATSARLTLTNGALSWWSIAELGGLCN